MIEMVISLAFFFIIATTYVYIQTTINISISHSINYFQAISIAAQLIEEIRGGRGLAHSYTFNIYTIDINHSSYTIQNTNNIIDQARIKLSWIPKNSKTIQSYTLIASTSYEKI
jgi:Tfp pilus assembly protein PilV